MNINENNIFFPRDGGMGSGLGRTPPLRKVRAGGHMWLRYVHYEGVCIVRWHMCTLQYFESGCPILSPFWSQTLIKPVVSEGFWSAKGSLNGPNDVYLGAGNPLDRGPPKPDPGP